MQSAVHVLEGAGAENALGLPLLASSVSAGGAGPGAAVAGIDAFAEAAADVAAAETAGIDAPAVLPAAVSGAVMTGDFRPEVRLCKPAPLHPPHQPALSDGLLKSWQAWLLVCKASTVWGFEGRAGWFGD